MAYTIRTWAEGTATLGSDRSAGPGAGIAGRRRAALGRVDSGPKALNPGSARAEPSQTDDSLRRRGFGAPALRSALENVSMMEEAVEHGADCGRVSQQLAPVVDRSVGRE